mgnify:CR=1 FL=1
MGNEEEEEDDNYREDDDYLRDKTSYLHLDDNVQTPDRIEERVGLVKRFKGLRFKETITKKKFLEDVLGKNFSKNAGPNSKSLFESIKLIVNERGKIIRGTFRGKKIFVRGKGETVRLSTNNSLKPFLDEFEGLWQKAQQEFLRNTMTGQSEQAMTNQSEVEDPEFETLENVEEVRENLDE